MKERIFKFWGWMTRTQPLLVAALLTGVVAILDNVTGTELRLFPLYFIPLSLIAGSRSTKFSVATAMGLTGVWALSNYNPAELGIYLGNIGSQLVAFVLVALLVSGHKVRADIQRQLASTDALTGLLNSRAFFEAANREIAIQRRRHYPITMAYLDVDDFKQVNAHLGHVGADKVLRDTARAMQESLRQTDFIGRVGGDEFVILLPDTAAGPASATLERLRQAVLQANQERRMKITVSVGAVVFEKPAKSVNAMMELSDQLMYDVKGKHKDGVALRRACELPAPSTPKIPVQT